MAITVAERGEDAGKVKLYPFCRCREDGAGFECSQEDDENSLPGAWHFDHPPERHLLTGERLIDVTDADDESLYYLHTTDMFRLRRLLIFNI